MPYWKEQTSASTTPWIPCLFLHINCHFSQGMSCSNVTVASPARYTDTDFVKFLDRKFFPPLVCPFFHVSISSFVCPYVFSSGSLCCITMWSSRYHLFLSSQGWWLQAAHEMHQRRGKILWEGLQTKAWGEQRGSKARTMDKCTLIEF